MYEWYVKQSKNVKFLIYCAIMTIGFCGMFCLVNINLLQNGKSLIVNDDSLSTYYEMLLYRKKLAKQVWDNLIQNHSLEMPWINYNLIADRNVGVIVGHEIFDVILWFVPEQCHEMAYCAVIAARAWLSGLTFSLFCFYKGCGKKATLYASYIYMFSGFAIVYILKQPPFATLLYLTPLLLIGLEKIIEGKHGVFFSVMVAVSIFSISIGFYYITFAGVIYFAVRLFTVRKSVKEKVFLCLRTLLYYFVGIALSAVVFFPIVYGIMHSSRIGADSSIESYLLYNWEQYTNFIKFFFTGENPRNYNYLGFSVMSLYPMLYVMVSKKQRKVGWWLVSVIILMNIPLFQLIAGGSIPSNRWTFCLGLAVSFCAATTLYDLMDKKPAAKEIKYMNIIAFVYFAVLLFFCVKEREAAVISAAVMIVICFLFYNLCWKYNKHGGVVWACNFALMFFSLVVNGCLSENEQFVNMFVDAGQANNILDGYSDILSREIDDAQFWRADKSKYETEMSCNLPYHYGYNGTSAFYVLNPEVIQYLSESGNPGLLQSNKVSDLNGRTTDEHLACVKYYFVKNNESEKIPYGFSFLKQSENNKENSIYMNNNALPLGYTYENMVEANTYGTLNIAQQQELMMKAAVISEEDAAFCNVSEYNTDLLNSREALEYDMVLSGIEVENDSYIAEKKGAAIELLIPVSYPQELYVQLSDIYTDGDRNCTIKVRYGNNEDTGILYSEAGNRRNDIDTFNFNVGIYESGVVNVLIEFQSGKQIIFGDVNVYGRDLSTVDNDINKLKKNSLQNVVFGMNDFQGDITITGNKILCFSIPYSKGWSCYVNGNEADLIKVNNIYNGIALSEGQYHIEMKYTPPYMKLGLWLGIAACVFLFGIFLYDIFSKKVQMENG